MPPAINMRSVASHFRGDGTRPTRESPQSDICGLTRLRRRDPCNNGGSDTQTMKSTAVAYRTAAQAGLTMDLSACGCFGARHSSANATSSSMERNVCDAVRATTSMLRDDRKCRTSPSASRRFLTLFRLRPRARNLVSVYWRTSGTGRPRGPPSTKRGRRSPLSRRTSRIENEFTSCSIE